MYTHLDAIPHKLTQGTEPVDFACDEHLWESVSVTVERSVRMPRGTHLEEVKRQAHVPEGRWVIRAERDGYTVVHDRRQWMHGH